MLENKAQIVRKNIKTPRAPRALKRALDPGRRGIGVRDHFRLGGGGTKIFARISHLCPKIENSNMFGQCIFASHGGGGGGG